MCWRWLLIRIARRDASSVKFWQLRALAWRGEERDDVGNGDGPGIIRPRLFEGREWYDEEDDSSEDEGHRGETDATLSHTPGAPKDAPFLPAAEALHPLPPPPREG